MKHFLHLTFFLFFILASIHSLAQLTKLSNNTNLERGTTLGGIGVLISRNDSLWRTDGTPAPGGTFMYAPNVSVDTFSGQGILSNKLLFAGREATNGGELWATDGTAGGTQLVKDIEAGPASSSPNSFVVFNSQIYFVAKTTATGNELWKTDGTNAGTVIVKDINPTGDAFAPAFPIPGLPIFPNFFVNNNILYFFADDGVNGKQLWKSDGTPGGTIPLTNNPTSIFSPITFVQFAAIGPLVFFPGNDGTRTELWKTDGTPGGTGKVKATTTSSGVNPSQLLVFNGKLYYSASTTANGTELWVSDGTDIGTSEVKNINPGGSGSNPQLTLAVFIAGKFYFSATDGSGTELWSSDGTGPGTQIVADINPGPGGSNPFFLLNAFNATSLDAARSTLTNGKMFFMANDGSNGTEIWTIDGTTLTTSMVKDINPAGSGINLSNFSYFFNAAGLYIAADDGTSGVELWNSNGTNPGTSRVFNLNPGTASSFPQFVMLLGPDVLLTADDGDNNPTQDRDLYKLGPQAGPLPITLLAFTASLDGSIVQLKWSTTSETNSSHFEIERSKNGTVFEKIGSLNAAVSSTQKASYQFADVAAAKAGVDKLFYRLNMVDKDGKSAHSNIAVINIIPDTRLLYSYPNPANDKVLVTVNGRGVKQATLKITDQNGRLYYGQKLNSLEGTTQYKINVSQLAKGIYFIQLITNDGVKSVKFIKN